VGTLIKFVVDNHIGDISSVLGVFIAIFGFWITIKNIKRAKQISQKVREDIAKVNTIEEFSAALMTMNEIKTLNREGNYSILPDKCSALRKSLISIRKTTPKISENHKESLQNAIIHFADIEKKIEKYLANKEIPIDVPRINNLISKQVDNLNEVLIEIKTMIGR
jgi:hypothetical protein